jgi:hypothetical protein
MKVFPGSFWKMFVDGSVHYERYNNYSYFFTLLGLDLLA